MTHQSSLTDFVSRASSSSTQTSYDGDIEEAEVESESETEFSDSDSKASTASPVPKPKRCLDSSDGKHRKSGFDPKWAQEFKWLEKVEKGGCWACSASCARNMASHLETGRQVGAHSLVTP